MDKWEQELEEKIRKKLSEGSVDFDEAAWKRMEQRLGPGRKMHRLFPVSWLRVAAAVLLAGFAIWAYTGYFRNAPGRAEKQPFAVGNQPATGESPLAGNQAPVENQPDEKDVHPSETEGSSDEQSGGDAQSIRNVQSAPEGRSATDAIPAARGSQAEAAGRGDRDTNFERETIAGNPAGLSKTGVRDLIRKDVLAAAPSSRLEAKWPSKQELPAAARPAQKEAGAAPVYGTVETVPEKKNIRFSMGVLAAPDLNGVAGLNGGKMGLNTGLGIGLHFNDRLSLHSGIVYSRKPYNARPADYQSGYSPRDLVNIAAVCDVIDIPLDLRYTVYRRGLNSISISAGLSSYLMLREQYEYEYHYDEARMYEYRNENRHFMGIGNAGLSLERKISDKMSLGIEPFVKVPLTGIGHGSVRLLSAGAALRLNLDMTKRRNTSKK